MPAEIFNLTGEPLHLPELTLEDHAREALVHLEAMRALSSVNSLRHLRFRDEGSTFGFTHWLRRIARVLDWLDTGYRDGK